MYRLCITSAVLFALSAGASHAQETSPVAAENTAQIKSPAPAKTVEIKNFGEQTVCKDITLPGSRIVLEKRCYTRNAYDRSEAKRAELQSAETQERVRQLRRMQDNMERLEREREMQRERAIAAMMVGGR